MPSRADFKDRELDILKQHAAGLSDRAIASRLSLSIETVRWYNKQLYGKLGVASRGDAVERARALGLLDSAPAANDRAPITRSAIQYAANDGASIAYQVIGSGPVDLLFIPGFVSHLELSWEEPGYTTFFEMMGRHARVIIFDKRGVGLSDRLRGAPTLEQTISDARCVLRAAGSTRAFVCGTSEGGAAAVLLASTYPEQVRGLVLISATPMPARHGAEPAWSRPWAAFERNITLIQQTWGTPWAVERFAPTMVGNATFEAWWSRTLRSASSPTSVRAIMEAAMQVDIRPLLQHVHTRALVLHRVDDVVVLVGAARYLAARLPNATLVEFPGGEHLYFVQPQPIAQAIIEFLAEPDVSPKVDSWIAIILHAEGAGARLNEATRGILATFDARHVRATAGGWVALFDAPNRAIRCAERVRTLGRGRAGGMALHVGACRTGDGAPVGSAQEISGRLAASANEGEILVSSVLRDILAGSELALVARSLDAGDGDGNSTATTWRLSAPY